MVMSLVFDRVPDLLDPTNLSWPFKDGMLATQKARASVTIASDKSIAKHSFGLWRSGILNGT